jgi:ribonuclease VapC
VIVIDTSALMAIMLEEAEATNCLAAIGDGRVMISAGTLSEALIVAAGRHSIEQMSALIAELDLEVVSLTPESARLVGKAYVDWGKGLHPAGLNFGDCFAYQLASERNRRQIREHCRRVMPPKLRVLRRMTGEVILELHAPTSLGFGSRRNPTSSTRAYISA